MLLTVIRVINVLTLTLSRVIIEGYAGTQLPLIAVPMMVGKHPTRDREVLGVLEHTLAPVLWYGKLFFRTHILT
jgi:hypothetical protein